MVDSALKLISGIDLSGPATFVSKVTEILVQRKSQFYSERSIGAPFFGNLSGILKKSSRLTLTS